MSRAAQELERQVREMRATAAKERKRSGKKGTVAADTGDNEMRAEEIDEILEGEGEEIYSGEGIGEDGNVGEAPAGAAPQQDQEAAVAKQKTGRKGGKAKAAPKAAKAAKAAKAPKPAKAAKGGKRAAAAASEEPKAARKPRAKKVVKGEILKCEPRGLHACDIQFEEGSINLAPTGNRAENRDTLVAALQRLIKRAGKK